MVRDLLLPIYSVAVRYSCSHERTKTPLVIVINTINHFSIKATVCVRQEKSSKPAPEKFLIFVGNAKYFQISHFL